MPRDWRDLGYASVFRVTCESWPNSSIASSISCMQQAIAVSGTARGCMLLMTCTSSSSPPRGSLATTRRVQSLLWGPRWNPIMAESKPSPPTGSTSASWLVLARMLLYMFAGTCKIRRWSCRSSENCQHEANYSTAHCGPEAIDFRNCRTTMVVCPLRPRRFPKHRVSSVAQPYFRIAPSTLRKS